MAEQGWMICSVKFSFRSCSQSGFSWGVFGDDFTERAAVAEEITAVEDAPAISGTGEDAPKALSTFASAADPFDYPRAVHLLSD